MGRQNSSKGRRFPQAPRGPVNTLLTVPTPYRWTVCLLFVGLVVALSLAPGVARPGDSIFVWIVTNTATPVQKLMHVIVYAVLALLWVWTLQTIESAVSRFGLALTIAVGLGALLEWYQTQVPGRFGTVGDVLLDLAGSLIGLLAAFLLL